KVFRALDKTLRDILDAPDKLFRGDGKIGTVEEKSEGFIYDKNTLQRPTAGDLQQKAILCPKNTTADDINAMVLEMLHGESKVYTSSDEAIPVGSDRGELELLYPPE
ncbi:DNA helicase, partial [Tanacetum coccineum]